MGTWKYDQPPTWKRDAVATNAGWCHPKTGEVLACCPHLKRKRRKKLDEADENLITEDGSLFVLETQNTDTTDNFLDLEEE
jgi:hypothetical protein